MNLIACIILILMVYINGWTDVPDTIAPSIVSGAMSYRSAVITVAVGNALGAVCGGIIFPAISSNTTLFLSSETCTSSLIAVMLTVIFWAIIAWYFGIPTSESHALLAALTGSRFASEQNRKSFSEMKRIFLQSGWGKLLLVIFISVLLGYICGYLFCRFLHLHAGKHISKRILHLQRAGAFLSSLLHGALDAQKFAVVFFALCNGAVGIPSLRTISLCGGIMALGCLTCGHRIINHLTREVTQPDACAAASADFAAALCLLPAMFLGYPLGTTQVKTSALGGSCDASPGNRVQRSGFFQIIFIWVITLPCCAAISFCLTQLFL